MSNSLLSAAGVVLCLSLPHRADAPGSCVDQPSASRVTVIPLPLDGGDKDAIDCKDVSPYGPGGCFSNNQCDGWPQNLCMMVGIGPGATCACEY